MTTVEILALPAVPVSADPTTPAHTPAPGVPLIVTVGVWMLVGVLAMLLRRISSTAAPTARETPGSNPGAPIEGLEDDPVRWPPPVVRGDWTALDERQLIRLLTESASRTQQRAPCIGVLLPPTGSPLAGRTGDGAAVTDRVAPHGPRDDTPRPDHTEASRPRSTP